MGSSNDIGDFAKQLFDHFAWGIVGFDAHFRLLCLNRAIHEKIKQAPSSLEGMALETFIQAANPSLHLLQKSLRAGNAEKFVGAIHLGEFSGRYAFEIHPFMENGAFQGGYLTFDIDQPVSTEFPANLSALAEAFNVCQEAILITDAQLDRPGPRILDANPAFEALTGYSKRALIGETPRILQGPKTDPAVLQDLREKLERGEVFQGETVNYRKDGYEFILQWEIYPLKNEQGVTTHYLAVQRDVTRQRRAEHGLKERETQLRHLMANAPVAMFVHDKGEFLFANTRAAWLFGFDDTDALLGKNLFDFIHEDFRHIAYDRLEELEGGNPIEPLEEVFLKQDGSEIDVEVVGIPIAYNGRPAIQTIVIDISERKKTEQELIENQHFIESIAEHSPNVIHIYNYREQRFIYSNRYIVNILGYTGEEIEALPNGTLSLYHPDDIPLIQNLYSQNLALADGETNDQEFRMQDKQGNWHWLASKDTVFRRDADGEVLETIGIVQDITERKHAEESLKRSEALFRRLFQNSLIGIAILDEDSVIQNTNEGFRKIFGYTANEAVSRHLNDLIIPEGHQEEASRIAIRAKNGETYQKETVRVDKEGNQIPVLLYKVPVFYADKPINIFGIYVDVSEREQAMEDLQQQTNELLRINAELEQFAYVTSHNLRSPVVNLQSLIAFFDESELQDADNQYVFQKISQSVDQLNETLEDLVEIVGKKKELSQPKEAVNFDKLLAKVQNTLNQQLVACDAEMRVDFSGAPEIYYLRSFLESILQNLLSNALKYRAKDRKPVIQITTHKDNGYVCLTFSDNGLGMDLEKHGDQLFNLYKRFHKGISGKGMGLYIIKSQVESLGGRVDVDSKVNEGTTFYLYLKDFG